MVATKVDVFTKSYLPDSKGYLWSSDGWVKQISMS
jgi:HSP90 family molecular chaperone